MAEMFPDLNKIARITSINESEIRFYRLLQNSKYTKNWKVFYSYKLSDGSYLREVDFVVFIPKEGIILVELKANNPVKVSSYEFVYNYNGREVSVENPFRKMKNITHQFKTQFDLTEEEKQKLFVSHIIVFPNLNREFDISVCGNKLYYINGKIKWEEIPWKMYYNFKELKGNVNRIGKDADEKEIDEIIKKIVKDFKSDEHFFDKNTLDVAERNIELRVKNNLMSHYLLLSGFKRLFLMGPASCGKGYYAFNQIRNYNEKLKIAYVCDSKNLYRNREYDFHKTRNVDVYMYSQFPEKSKKREYDLIILDEFENYISGDYIEKINPFIKNGVKNGNLIILFDNYRNFMSKSYIYGFIKKYNFENFFVENTLNFRNSPKIIEFIHNLFDTDIYSRAFVDFYKSVRVINYENNIDFENKFSDILDELKKENYRYDDIKVISLKQVNESIISYMLSRKKWHRILSEYSRVNRDVVSYVYYPDFMGLDSNAVIITDIDETVDNLEQALYLSATRAKFELILFVKKSMDGRIRKYL